VRSYTKLNIGCGKDFKEDFVNLDLYEKKVDVKGSADKLPFKNNVFEFVYASHVLEHFPFREIDLVLKEWKRVLKEGGTLEIKVPDIEYHFRQILKGDWGERNLIAIWGDQREVGLFHGCGFTKERLSKQLEEHFVEVEVKVGLRDGIISELIAVCKK